MSEHSPSGEGMSSSRPYMIRAIHAWISDNGMTPYIVVDATDPLATVPEPHVHEGRIVLNSSYDAVSGLSIENDWISFSARFSGVSEHISFPPAAVRAIYAQENGQGMIFPEELEESQERDEAGEDDLAEGDQTLSGPPPGSESALSKKGRPTLKIVK